MSHKIIAIEHGACGTHLRPSSAGLYVCSSPECAENGEALIAEGDIALEAEEVLLLTAEGVLGYIIRPLAEES